MNVTTLIFFFVACLTFSQSHARNLSIHEGPVVKVEVTCKYVNLFSLKSDTTASSQRKVFPKGSILSISGDDKTNSPAAIYITVNQAAEERYKEPLRLLAKGRHTVKIRALDSAGHETTMTITYLVIE